ncbi:LamG domain-containing protein [Micromonospora sp. CPCC 206060]|uniref:LamG domain-containing protein n=1 Tax=Micromonospora sp. CPCC 206060 TaxID=3122406 RepID=UPI002FF04218
MTLIRPQVAHHPQPVRATPARLALAGLLSLLLLLVGAPALAHTTTPFTVTVTVGSAPAGVDQPGTFTISSTEPTVTKFRYGWGFAGTEVAATGTTVRSATVTLDAPSYGTETIVVIAIAEDGHEAHATLDVTVPGPFPAVGSWELEAYPGVTQAKALADQEPMKRGDTPLTGTGITWADDTRLIGDQTPAFNGTSAYLSAAPQVMDTSTAFSVATWVRLTDKSVDRAVASKEASGYESFGLGYRKQTDRWTVVMPSKTSGPGITWSVAQSTTPARLGLWTHLATSYDPAAQTLRLWVNGVLEATATGVTGFNDPQGEFRLGNAHTWWWHGNMAQARVYDRVVTSGDLNGLLEPEPGAGTRDEPGLLHPVKVGAWNAEGAVACYEESDDPDLCVAPDTSIFDRRFRLTKGTHIEGGRRGDVALTFDDTHWIDDPSDPHYGETTQEYGWSQKRTGEWGNWVWEDTPIVRTDQSFTVSTWVTLDPTRGAQTVVAQETAGYSGFTLSYRPDNGGQWVFRLRDNATDPTATVAVAAATDPQYWHHLVAVLDTANRQIRLYVDGVLAQAVTMNSGWQPWAATGPVLLARSTTPAGPAEWLHGKIDDLEIYHGVLADKWVQDLHEDQHY